MYKQYILQNVIQFPFPRRASKLVACCAKVKNRTEFRIAGHKQLLFWRRDYNGNSEPNNQLNYY